MIVLSSVSADAFLLPVGSGYRFCILRLPASRRSLRGAVLVAPPFAEELNKSRRMIALAADRIAASGYAVLQIDCLGCGDSSGDFDEATWAEWLSDIGRSYDLLANRYGLPIWILAVRAGALLATAALARINDPPNLVFWQPVVSGRQHLTQFLRLKLANEFLGERGASSSTQALLGRLTNGETLEVAGYTLTPTLAMGLAAAELEVPHGFGGRVVCLEVGARANADVSPALSARTHAWRQRGAPVLTETVSGVAFWQTQQITEAPELIDVTLSHLLQSGR